jgi:DegV family protein with EDD domain
VTVFDSLTGSLGLGLQVLRACDLARAGRTASEVAAELARYRGEMNTLVLLNTLENIVRGGRLSRFQGNLSKLLDIRVLLHDESGKVVLLERVHGRRKLMDRALQRVRVLRPDLSDRDVGITHFNNPFDAEALREALAEQCHPRGFIVNEMGPTMATYAGEGGIIVAF